MMAAVTMKTPILMRLTTAAPMSAASSSAGSTGTSPIIEPTNDASSSHGRRWSASQSGSHRSASAIGSIGSRSCVSSRPSSTIAAASSA